MIRSKDHSTFTSATEYRQLSTQEMLEVGIAAAIQNTANTPVIVIDNVIALPPPKAKISAEKPATKAKRSPAKKATKAKVKAEPIPGKRRLADGKVVEVALPRRYKRTLKDGTVQWCGPAFRGYVNEVDALSDTTNFIGGHNRWIGVAA